MAMREGAGGVTFSVIVPTRNRPQALANCLRSLAAQDYSRGTWELIVVNDGGRESLTAVGADLRQCLPLHVIEQAQAGPAAARNTGASAAAGRFLAFTDDDCRVAPDWLTQFETGFAATGADGLGGQTRPFGPVRSGMQASQFLADFLVQHKQDAQQNAGLLLSNNVAYRREAFAAVGGFDASFPFAAAEDMDLSRRLVQAGYRQRYFPDALVWHDHRLTAWGHVQQQFRYGRGGYYYLQKAAAADGQKEYFYRRLLRALLQAQLPWRTRGLVAAAQVAYRLGLGYERLVAS